MKLVDKCLFFTSGTCAISALDAAFKADWLWVAGLGVGVVVCWLLGDLR